MSIENIKNHPRYKRFTFFEVPVAFNEYFKDKDYNLVQVHDISDCTDPVGYVGDFEWKSNVLKPLDGDTYNEDMTIWGFNVFINKDIQECLDVLSTDY